MDDLQSTEESVFVAEDVQNIIKDSIEAILGAQSYNHGKVTQWNSDVIEQTMRKLASLNKPFKYVVNAVIMQKNGAGLHLSSSCFWNNSTDGKAAFP
eukprot:CAMPEP_0113873690 /NCGR_PEP_ID=MMETSP0780_2-20120614/3914_1 /TAXON_ID=652834 /ORGANISM="Palpitomonas bilix" /LENGTH=96 /DNA_ID=CAMNT_0000859371 /DNA_START=273 /DNA_END=563 /DNA_ORIENTATION=- /assembly_acc=CAM_ASM_000599